MLVTGGAGFIGSHTTDRLLELGHQVTVLDALTAPVHRNGRPPEYLSGAADFYQGDVGNRDLLTNLLRRVDAVYHLAAYQDYLPDFSRFSQVNVVSTALIFEIAVAERLDLARVVVASSQAAMGEGLYRCREHGEQTPGMRAESALARGDWDLTCPVCAGPLEMQATPERISNPQNAYGMSKYGQEMVAVNLGRRYGIPTVAMRYSIVQGPRQSVYNAYSGACRIFCLHYLLGQAPTLYEDGEMVRDFVNIDDVVDANVAALEDEGAAGRVFNVGGGAAVTTREFAEVVRRHYGSDQPGRVTGEYRFGDTRHILSDVSALKELGWAPRRGPAESVASYASWLEGMEGLDGVLAEANAKMRQLGVVRRSADVRGTAGEGGAGGTAVRGTAGGGGKASA
ncbi:MAG: dTDP-L-rhamnose 4-epimerase [Acidimicrobiaceae bacterium]|nr:dTDP-L-rhamnose 4-epimerase [Acidimicrobiaceae bacterium]